MASTYSLHSKEKEVTVVSVKLLLQHRELHSVLCGDLNGMEIQKRWDICIRIVDSPCCTVETNTTL